MNLRYLVIEGPIGVGKTSLAKKLAEELDARVFLEDVEENPFLKKFYESGEKFAFQTQIFFLLSRYRAQMEMAQQDLFQQSTIADYLFAKDRLFARLNLSDDELALYEQIYVLLDHNLPRPDLVVFLQANPRVLLERIRKRDKEYEKNISLDYLKKICNAYSDYFFYYKDAPLLVINTDHLDFMKNRDDFEELVKELRSVRGGVQYFVPLGSR